MQPHILAGMRAALAALARTGNSVIVDHVLLEPRWLDECAALLGETPAYLVGVRCPRAIAIQRELRRGYRSIDLVESHFDRVHRHGVYDFEVDLSNATAGECPLWIKEHVLHGPEPSAFARLSRESRVRYGCRTGTTARPRACQCPSDPAPPGRVAAKIHRPDEHRAGGAPAGAPGGLARWGIDPAALSTVGAPGSVQAGIAARCDGPVW